MAEETKEQIIRCILAGVCTGDEEDFEHSMQELGDLAAACGYEVVGIITQKIEQPSQTFYVGSGKVEEIRELITFTEADQVIFDDTLTPAQMRNLGKVLDISVYDRTGLILDIFALRARSREARLQVETAKLKYMLPRLIGMREALGRQGGTSGSMSNKGVGETKLELDRRKIEHRISELGKELDEIEKGRATMRSRRNKTGIYTVALVGYTNAGKSTILNHMVMRYGAKKDKTVLEKDMLFATLETSVRSLEFDDNRSFLLADTVGFIHKLPHGLVKAFRSTLDEVKYADLLLHVVDYSDENHKEHMKVTQETLQEIGAGAIRQILVYNKADLAGSIEIPKVNGDTIYISASLDKGLEELSKMIRDILYMEECTGKFLIPYEEGSAASDLMEHTRILKREYLPEGLLIESGCKNSYYEKYKKYLFSE